MSIFSQAINKHILLSIIVSLLLLGVSAFAYETGVINGLVTDSATGRPIYGASVIIVGKPIGAKTDISGKFIINKVPAGTFHLKSAYIGYSSKAIESVLTEGDTITVSMKLAANDHLDKITVVRSDVNRTDTLPKDSTTVTTVDQLLTQVAGVVQDSNGQVFIRGGRAGDVAYIIDGMPLHYPLNRFGEEVIAGTGIITGYVLDSVGGAPLYGASVQVDGTDFGAKTDTLGMYTIRNIPEGIYTIRINCMNYVSVDVPSVSVVAYSTITLTKKLRADVTEICIPLKIKTPPDSTK